MVMKKKTTAKKENSCIKCLIPKEFPESAYTPVTGL